MKITVFPLLPPKEPEECLELQRHLRDEMIRKGTHRREVSYQNRKMWVYETEFIRLCNRVIRLESLELVVQPPYSYPDNSCPLTTLTIARLPHGEQK